MFFNNIKHNLIIILCILLMINGCNYENSKLIIENNNYLNDIIDQINHLLSNGKAFSEVSKNWKK